MTNRWNLKFNIAIAKFGSIQEPKYVNIFIVLIDILFNK